jgi:dihydropyrimidine dehydrogenase (NAD+) subunit PreA
MADLRTDFVGIKSPNPFWLASAPPTDKEYNVVRAFRAGWGGVVWKTLGEAGPPIVNVNGPRYGAIHGADRRLLGLNNIELITDRPLEVNLREIKQVKRDWPDRAMVVSLMVPCTEDAWKAILKEVEGTGCDGVELNFGCPHGMSERGMGSAVGQVPEYIEMVARWCKQHTRMPVIVKLTPNVTNIRAPARAAKAGGADAVSLINTVNSIIAIDLDNFAPVPTIDGKGSHGGYCGPAVKPIALNMVAEIARDKETAGLPISAIGGITTWRDAAEFISLGAGTVQVCTAAMTYGFRIVTEMISGLEGWMDRKGYRRLGDFQGNAVPNVTDWQYLNLNYVTKARINQDLCIKCGRCYAACEDTSHQAISSIKDGKRHFEVIDAECVACNLCVEVCPVEGCITMERLMSGIDARTGKPIDPVPADWTTHPNNPMTLKAAE